MKILNKMFASVMAFVMLVSNFGFVGTVFAEDNNSGDDSVVYADGQVVDGFKEVGSTSQEGDVYLSKEVNETDEDGIYQVTLKTKGKTKKTTESKEVPIYTVVVFDKSGSMKNYYDGIWPFGENVYKWDNAVAGAKEFARSLIQTYNKAEIALVTFDTNANPGQFANSNLDNANFGSPGGNTSLGKALKEANSLLDNVSDDTANKYIVVISDGAPTDGDAYQGQATYAKENGYEIFAIGYEDAGTALKNMVSEPKNKHYSDGNTFNIQDVFSNIVDNIEVISPAATNAKIKDVIGDEFEYVEGSSVFDGNSINPIVDGKELSFDIGNIDETEKVVSFKIKINSDIEPGLYDTNGIAKVEYDDGEEIITESPKVNVKGYTYKVNYLDKVTGEALINQKTVNNKLYNHTYTETAKEVNGFNVDEDSKDITITEDNQEITFYYTRKNDLSYTVNYYNDDLTNFINSHTFGNQTFNTQINASDINVNEFKEFGYQDGVIKTTMPYTIIDGINVIQVLYNKRNDLTYNVDYKDVDTLEKILESETRENKTYLEIYTETAKEAPYGYVLEGTNVQNIFVNAENKTITFYYKKRNDFKYTVKYIDKDTKKEIHEKKIVENKTYKEEIEETAEEITGYNLVGDKTQTMVIDAEDKEIVFYYTKKNDLSYTVNYYNDDLTNFINSHTFGNQTFNTQINASDINVNEFKEFGYQDGVIKTTMPYTIIDGINVIQVLYNKRNDLTYTVKYVDKEDGHNVIDPETKKSKTYLETYEETAKEAPYGYVLDDDSTKNVLMDADNKVVTFYYKKRNDFEYKVKYLEKDTNEELSTTKTVKNKKYKEEVEETAKVISGYNLVGDNTKTMVIDAEDKEIVFYYTKKNDLSYTVNYYTDDADKTLVGNKTINNVTFDSMVNSSDIDVNYKQPKGYQDGLIVTKLPYRIIDGENIIDVLYKLKDNLSYRVEYYYGDSIDDSKTEYYENILYGTVIDTYVDKNIDGYEFDSYSGKLVVTDDKDNVIKVYYSKVEKDEEEIPAPDTGVDAPNNLLMLLGFLPIGLLSIRKKLNNATSIK